MVKKLEQSGEGDGKGRMFSPVSNRTQDSPNKLQSDDEDENMPYKEPDQKLVTMKKGHDLKQFVDQKEETFIYEVLLRRRV